MSLQIQKEYFISLSFPSINESKSYGNSYVICVQNIENPRDLEKKIMKYFNSKSGLSDLNGWYLMRSMLPPFSMTAISNAKNITKQEMIKAIDELFDFISLNVSKGTSIVSFEAPYKINIHGADGGRDPHEVAKKYMETKNSKESLEKNLNKKNNHRKNYKL